MARVERWIVYPILALLCWAGLGRDLPSGFRSAAAGGEPVKVVDATGFRVLDAAGHVRAVLGVIAKDGTLGLQILDKDGKERAELSVEPDGTPGVVLRDKDASPQVSLGVASDGALHGLRV